MLNKENLNVLDFISNAVIIVDTKIHEIVYYNRVANHLLGLANQTNELSVDHIFSKNKGFESDRNKIYKALYSKGYYISEDIVITHPLGAQYVCDCQISYYDESKEYIYVILKNNDQVSTIYKNLITELSFFDAIQGITDDLIFRIELKDQVINFFGKSIALFQWNKIMGDFPNCLIESEVIPPEDHIVIKNLASAMYKGENGSAIFRLQSNTGDLNWYKAEYLIIENDLGEKSEAVGKICNIQEKVELQQKINIDSLTGCYTKYAFEVLSKELLNNEPEKKHVFFIIDIDFFKAINDNFGHKFGDEVLQDIGLKLRKILREDDCIGRIGGDEFMLYIKNLSDMEVVKRKAEQILKNLVNEYTLNEKKYSISGSIGIAVYPFDGSTFAQLYHNADVALYEGKRSGRNRFTFFNELEEINEEHNEAIYKASKY